MTQCTRTNGGKDSDRQLDFTDNNGEPFRQIQRSLLYGIFDLLIINFVGYVDFIYEHNTILKSLCQTVILMSFLLCLENYNGRHCIQWQIQDF